MGILEGMQGLLASLARYVGDNRLYEFEAADLGAELVVERWQGWESLSSGFEWWVDLLSHDAGLPIEQMLGQRATLITRGADGARIRRSGLVRQARCIGSDGGLARYRVCLVPWTWLLSQGRHSRVFQDKSVADIAQAVFAAYAPLAAWQVADEVGPFLAQRRPRSYCVQYRETDFDFISRLLAEEGLGWRIEEDDSSGAGHKLVLFADSTQCPFDPIAEAGRGIRFHRADGTEESDTLQALGSVRRLGAGSLALLSTDYKSVQAQSATLPLLDAGEAAQEHYDAVGPYAFADRTEAEHFAGLIAQAHEAQRVRWFGRGTVRSFRAGTGFAVLGAPQSGETPPPENLLIELQQIGINNLPPTVREGLQQWLGAAVPPPMPGVAASLWKAVVERAEAVGYANCFHAIPRDQPWRPALTDETGLRLNPRPTAPGGQTAIVVGAGGGASPQGSNELHSDALGRLRVRLHFQGQAGDGEASDTCWLRVAQRYAGPGVGSQFLPRIGQEVLITFLEGDIDRPLIAGALYNGQGEAGIAATPGAAATAPDSSVYAQAGDHRPSAQANRIGGQAPPWHGMSGDAAGHRNPAGLLGIQSKEFGGEGHSRLLFDDHDGQLRLQLATTQAATQLNLGHLIHQADNYRGSFRGEGFELRSDQWGAVRARAGLWISASAVNGDTPAGDHVAATALLKQASQLGQTLSDIAGTHQTVRLAAHQGVHKPGQSRLIDAETPLKALLTSARTVVAGKAFEDGQGEARERKPAPGEDRVPHPGDALLGLHAPAGIGIVAGQALHWSAGETLTLASGAASNAAIAGDLRLHSGQAIGWLATAVKGGNTEAKALSLVTAEGELIFEAQHDLAKFQSRDQLKIISANAEVELAAGKTVHLAVSGGASITIEGGNISIACPGNITVHAQKKSFVGATNLKTQSFQWTSAELKGKRLISFSG